MSDITAHSSPSHRNSPGGQIMINNKGNHQRNTPIVIVEQNQGNMYSTNTSTSGKSAIGSKKQSSFIPSLQTSSLNQHISGMPVSKTTTHKGNQGKRSFSRNDGTQLISSPNGYRNIYNNFQNQGNRRVAHSNQGKGPNNAQNQMLSILCRNFESTSSGGSQQRPIATNNSGRGGINYNYGPG